MKDEEMKDIHEPDLAKDAVDNAASDTDFVFIPAPASLTDAPLFFDENEESEAVDLVDAPDEAAEPVEEDSAPLATDDVPPLSLENIAAQAYESTVPPDEIDKSQGDAVHNRTETEEADAPDLGEPSEPVLNERNDIAFEKRDDTPVVEDKTDFFKIQEQEPTLLPEDILAATEQKEEQISFFDFKEPAPAPKEETKKERPIDTRFDFLEICIFTLVAVLIITTFFFRHSIVDGSSMEPTLSDKEHLILASFLYTPETGDIIVCEDYSTVLRKPIVKRVIATEGQTVVIAGPQEIYVDGVRLEEAYANPCNIHGDGTNYPIVHTVAEGHVFVMGDHRDASTDSRVIGDVSVDSIIGKVVLRLSPFTIFD